MSLRATLHSQTVVYHSKMRLICLLFLFITLGATSQDQFDLVLQDFKMGSTSIDKTHRMEAVDSLLRTQPNNFELNEIKASLHASSSELDSAIYYYKRCIEIDSTDANSYFNVAIMLFNRCQCLSFYPEPFMPGMKSDKEEFFCVRNQFDCLETAFEMRLYLDKYISLNDPSYKGEFKLIRKQIKSLTDIIEDRTVHN